MFNEETGHDITGRESVIRSVLHPAAAGSSLALAGFVLGRR